MDTAHMLCFHLSINGQDVTVAGLREPGVLSAILTHIEHGTDSDADTAAQGPTFLRLGGMPRTGASAGVMFSWHERPLSNGDIVTIRLATDSQPQEPVGRDPSRSSAQPVYVSAERLRSEIDRMERYLVHLRERLSLVESGNDDGRTFAMRQQKD